MKNPSGLSLQEIKKSGYLISPEREASEDMKSKSYKYLQQLKDAYKKEKNPEKKKVYEEMHKEHELELFKSGLLRMG
jgi:hypothetical protein